MKYILFILFSVTIASAKAQTVKQDKQYKRHCDSSEYYRVRWEKDRKSQFLEGKMIEWREKAKRRSWDMYDSTQRKIKP